MKKIDVSVILNLHREAPYLRAVLTSLETCAQVANATGLQCEPYLTLSKVKCPQCLASCHEAKRMESDDRYNL